MIARRTRVTIAFCFAPLTTLGLFVTSANAQSSSDSAFARDRNIAVRERSHPEYQPQGLTYGSFLVYPEVELAAQPSDNVFASSSQGKSDVLFRVKPAVSVRSTWSLNAFNAYARAPIDRYAKYSSENVATFEAGADGRYDIDRASAVKASVDYGSLVLPRTASSAVNTTAEPIRYDYVRAAFGASTERYRFRFAVNGSVQDYKYKSPDLIGGGKLFIKDRDRTDTYLGGRVEYAVRQNAAFYVAVTGNNHAYDLGVTATNPDRDSQGVDISVGTTFDISNLVRGDLRVGYLHQKYDRNIPSASEPSFDVRLEYFPTPLTTVSATASRLVSSTDVPLASAILQTGGKLQVDHELYRNVILSALVNTGHDAYKGIDRRDDRWSAQMSGTYLMNRKVAVTARYQHEDLSSEGAQRSLGFKVNVYTLSVVLRY